MNGFANACELWCELYDPGIVPLLKTVKIGDDILALMPRYAGNLRTLMQSGKHSPKEMLKGLSLVITSLLKVHEKCGLIHQAIKPENILFCYHNQKLEFEVSDWVQFNLSPAF